MKIFLIVLAVLIILAVVLVYMGAFSKVEVKVSKNGPYSYAYVEHIGDYSKVGEPMNKLDTELRTAGFNPTVGIGVYFDNPQQAEKSKLRSEVGSVIPAGEQEKIESQKGKFNFKTITEGEYITAEFPYRNSASFIFAVMKVYPVLSKYIADNGYQPVPSIELYDMANHKITFLMEAKK